MGYIPALGETGSYLAICPGNCGGAGAYVASVFRTTYAVPARTAGSKVFGRGVKMAAGC